MATTAKPKRAAKPKARDEFIPPGATSTVTPGGIMRNDPSADGTTTEAAPGSQPAKILARGETVAIEAIERHPINRHPAPADVHDRAVSLAEDGQLDDCEVRDLGAGRYQMISGETRLLAAMRLNWKGLRCTIIECDDAEAARRVALHNAQRKDLNTIEKAQLVNRLCINAGYTREQAAKHVGVESASAASNLVRLLRLPKIWQDRVVNGELKESYARLIVPVVEIPAVMKQLDEEFRSDDPWMREYWNDRDRLEDAVEEMVEQETERLEGSDLHPDEIEANRQKLGIVKVTLSDGYGPNAKKKEVEVATNVKLFRELNAAAAAKKQTAKAKQVGAEPASKPKPTKADLERAAEQRAQQLGRAIREWKEILLRREIAWMLSTTTAQAQPDAKLLKLVFHFLVDCPSSIRYSLAEQMHKALGSKKNSWDTSTWDVLTEALERPKDAKPWMTKLQGLALEISKWLIAGNGKNDPRGHVSFSEETLLSIFHEWGGDLTETWNRLYRNKHQAIVDFFEMHRKPELIELAKEAGDYLAPHLDKAAMVRLLTGSVTPPPVPKCLLPPQKETKAKAGKKAR